VARTLTCPNCGARAPVAADRCPECSVPLKLSCPECGSEARADADECPACGTSLANATSDGGL
jgi:uncharacterized membrane protein YvbJ